MKIQNFTIYRPIWVLAFCAFVASFLIVEILFHYKIVDRLEKNFTDAWHQIAEVRYQPKHTVLLKIDDKSLSALTNTPLVFWTPYIAQVIAALQNDNVKVVGLDLLFSTTAEQWLRSTNFNLKQSDINYDQPLRKEISNGKVILVSTTANSVEKDEAGKSYTIQIMPSLDMVLSVPDINLVKYIAYANLDPDSDGVIRKYADAPVFNFPQDVRDSNPPIFSLATLLSLHFYNYSEGMVKQVWRMGAEPKTIAFTGPPGTIPSISFIDYLNAVNDPIKYKKELAEYKNMVEDKVVIIGSDYVGLNDNHITPYGTNYFSKITNYMSGPEIQANITEAILSKKSYVILEPPLRWLIMAIFLLICSFSFRFLTTGYGTIVLIISLLISSFTGYSLFKEFIEFPVVALQVGIIFSFTFIYVLSFSGETLKRKHVEKVFGRYVSRSVVEQYIESGDMPSLGGESSNVTVLFSDIRNFTSLSEILKPQELIGIINAYFERATPHILNEDGHLDKFIGDAIMAEFGMPVRHVDHALRACRAAVNLHKTSVEFRQIFQQKLPQLQDFEFKVGVGVNTGNAVMGNIGSSTKTEYTALGDTVNVASRLEGATKDIGWDIVISEDTYLAAGDKLIVGRNDKIKVKGRAELIKIYELLGVKNE